MSQSLSRVVVHLVWSTKLSDRLHAYMGGILRSLKCIPIRIGGMPDHVHVLTTLHPTISQSKLLQVVKSKSSGWASDTLGRGSEFAWQNGYGAFSVSEQNVTKVASYIANQVRHHRTKTFKEEFIELLERAKMSYDPRYVWD